MDNSKRMLKMVQVYASGPLLGYVADTQGARVLTFAGSLIIGIGYLGLLWGYQTADRHIAPLGLLAAFSFCTGLGSNAGTTAAMNAVAKVFAPETVRKQMNIELDMP